MRRSFFLLVALLFGVLCCSGQSSGQFLFTMMDGSRFVRILDPAWEPVFKGNFLYITPRDRMLTVDLAAIRPVHPDDIRACHQVNLLFRSHLGRGSQTFWVSDAYRVLEDAPHRDGFLVLGPQTFIREGIYRAVVQ